MKNVTFYKFDIEPKNNLRLDQIISSHLPEYSRSTIKNWINAEKILVNGKTCSPKDKILIKSEIEIEVHPNKEIDIIPENIILNIPGVVSLISLNIVNKSSVQDNKIYSTFSFDIKQNLDRGMLFPPVGGIFEVKYPNEDITGRGV